MAFYVALLAGLSAVGRDVGMQIASVERGALNGIFKFKNGSQAVALAAHGSLRHEGTLFDPHVLFFRIFFFRVNSSCKCTTNSSAFMRYGVKS